MKKNDSKRAITVELVRNGEVVTVPDTATLLFKGSNGMCNEMIRDGDRYIGVFTQKDTSKVGKFDAEVEVTYEDYRIETFPEEGFIQFNVHDNIECGVSYDKTRRR